MKSFTQFIASILLGVALVSCARDRDASSPDASAFPEKMALLIVLDGLRPDYVTPELMPNLHALGKRGIVFDRHHAIFPTVTRVNASSIATGCYPAKNGVLGNAVFFPEVDPVSGLSTGNAENLLKIEKATGGQLLTQETLGEILDRNGKKLLVCSSGSSGSSFLLNHKVKGGGVINVEMSHPESLAAHAESILGRSPEETEPNTGRNAWAVDAYLKIGLGEIRPDATIIWLSDPDHTQHEFGVGAPETLESIRLVDAHIRRILARHRELGIENRVNIMVTSDHGFSTHIGPADVTGLLIERGLKASKNSDDVIIVDGAIYVKNRDREKIRAIVRALQETPWVGAIFTHKLRPGHPEGWVAGTMSFTVAQWDHARAADILVSANWSDDVGPFGMKGTTNQKGVAGHGTSSPWDVHNTLVVAGPDFKRRARIATPTGNVDLAPTILALIGIARPDTMQGRVIREAFADGPDPDDVQVFERSHKSHAEWEGGSFTIELHESSVDGTDYMDATTVER